MKNVYCYACSNQLISTGYEPYSEEAYYTCANCSTDYTVTEAGDDKIVIQADLKQENI